MSDPTSTIHVLKPHHLSLLRLIVMILQAESPRLMFGPIPSDFLLHVYRIVLYEISEVSKPRNFAELVTEIAKGPMADQPGPQKFRRDLAVEPFILQKPEQLSQFFRGVPKLFLEKDEEEDHIRFTRRSLFGYFCRRCFFSFVKLSFTGRAKLQKDYGMWLLQNIGEVASNVSDNYHNFKRDRLTNGARARKFRDCFTLTQPSDYQIYKTHADKRPFATTDAFAAYEKGLAVGDESTATENLRRFFEQHFHEENDSGLRQHALLNLARKHYMSHEYTACRKFLQEAIGVARTGNDKLTLQHCMSMLHRLPPTERGQKPILNDIQPDLHPLEVLYDVQKLVQIGNQQPLSASFEKVFQAIGLYDHWIDIQHGSFVESEQWGQHAVQSIVWAMHGSTRLSHIEENVVTAFTTVGGDDNNRVVVTLHRAYYRARQGKYRDAIAILLDPDVWRGLSIVHYNMWASEIWHILVLRASRRRQERQFAEFLKQRRPHGSYKPREYWFWSQMSLGSMIRDPLYEVMQMRGIDQGHAWIESLLTALWHAEFQNRYSLYRIAIILLADIGLEFGMTKWCRRIIDEIMPQVIDGSELEQRALACFVLARCIIAAGDSSPEALRECLPYLKIAEKDYNTLEIFRSLQDVQFLISVVYHNLGMTKERDEAAARQLKTEEEGKKAAAIVLEDWVIDVLEIVGDVGAALASR
ncbi:uncharacterized protein FIBRA_01149 [Fibroporia radiculosa]|uniref:Anaphase-promoting complex subunit 5 n=1 Tax=Fibroporia radiculosa TaxID=599839 RepID=J4H0Y0_9APHY|nr:uncharacterized protein FIBRA_01149 [Fibroporia radiculosa]CCL99134.1 predicted protein [Fibroporia radiculosa]